MSAKIDLSELSDDVRAQLGLPSSGSNGGVSKRRKKMTADDVRGYGIRCLSPLASLSKSERGRVLRHALKVNEV